MEKEKVKGRRCKRVKKKRERKMRKREIIIWFRSRERWGKERKL
jgi:hypothetical protein